MDGKLRSRRIAVLGVVLAVAAIAQIIFSFVLYNQGGVDWVRNLGWIVLAVSGVLGIIRHVGRRTPGEEQREDGMYETMLVPLDGSKRAETILPHVERLAQLCGAEVILLQVVDPPPHIKVPEEFDMALHQRQLERLAQRAQDYLSGVQDGFREKGIRTRRRIVHGPVAEAILTTADREKADLVAIASHGRTGLSRVFYGSVAAGVLHRVDQPLLVVRSRGSE